jgi:hypothetical protein
VLVLASNGQELAHTTCLDYLFPLSVANHNSASVKKRKVEFNMSIHTQFGDLNRDHVLIGEPDEFEPYLDDSMGDRATMPEADDYDHNAFDQYVNAEVLLPLGDLLATGKVIACKKGLQWQPSWLFK